MLNNKDSIDKWKNGVKKSVKTTIEKRKGKTYDDIYGDKAEEEKEKRSSSLLGKKRDPEIGKKIS